MPTLCEAILTATRDLHQKAEQSQLMKKYIDKTITLAEHRANLFQQMQIFEALESHLGKTIINDNFSNFLATLGRHDALKKDYSHLCKLLKLKPQTAEGDIYPATKAYVKHLNQISGDPVKLLAHAYVQYRALLNGGYILSRTIKKLLDPKESEGKQTDGVQFYLFDEALFREDNKFKDHMNALEGQFDANEFIAEVNKAYQFSIDIYSSKTEASPPKNMKYNCNHFWEANKKLLIPLAVTGTAILSTMLITKLSGP